MDEAFYTPPIPQLRLPRMLQPRTGAGRAYQFRQPQTYVNPLALRRLQLQDVLSRRREEIAAGHQEFQAMQEMARLEQQEYKVRQEIVKEKQVASAQREIAKLDPLTDPNYQQNYAEVMSRHPLAQDNKFLNEAFTAGARANFRVAENHFSTLEEGQKQMGREDLQWIKSASAYAAMGGDPSAFTDKDGNHDWNALFSAHAKAVNATKAAADAANAGLPITKTVTKEGDTTVTREAPKAAKPELTTAQKINIAKMEGTAAGQLAQQQIFQKQVDADPSNADAKKNLANVTANLALTKAQVDAVHQAMHPTPEGGLVGVAEGMKKTSPVTAPPAAATHAPVTTDQPPSEWTDPMQVKNEYQAGRLSRDQAVGILKDQFGHTD